MFVKAFVIGIFVVAVSSAVPLVTTDPSLDYETILDCNNPKAYNTPEPEVFHYEVTKKNDSVIKSGDSEIVIVLIPGKTNATHELQDKWTSVKSHVHSIFENLKKAWYKTANLGHKFSSDKNKTMNLVSATQKVYDDIVAGGKNNFTAFEVYSAQLKHNMKTGVENKTHDALVKFEELLKDFKDDVQKAKIAHAATTTPASLSGLKTDWDFAVRNWQNIHKEISSVSDSIIDSFKNVGKESKILYRNAETELSSIKSKITGLAHQAEKEFTEVVRQGKKDVRKFKSLTSEILTTFDDLKPVVGEVFEEAKNKLNHVGKKFDNFVSHSDSYPSEVDVVVLPD